MPFLPTLYKLWKTRLSHILWFVAVMYRALQGTCQCLSSIELGYYVCETDLIAVITKVGCGFHSNFNSRIPFWNVWTGLHCLTPRNLWCLSLCSMITSTYSMQPICFIGLGVGQCEQRCIKFTNCPTNRPLVQWVIAKYWVLNWIEHHGESNILSIENLCRTHCFSDS